MFPHANSNKLKLTQMQVYNANDLSNKTNSVRPDLNPKPLAKQSLNHELSGPLTPTQVPNPYKYIVTLSRIFHTISLTHTHTKHSFSFHSIFFLTQHVQWPSDVRKKIEFIGTTANFATSVTQSSRLRLDCGLIS